MVQNANDREVAIIIITPSGRRKSTAKGVILYIMTEADAKKLCSDSRTKGRGNYNGEWAYAYTGYWQDAFGVDDWRDIPIDRFRVDDGRMDKVFNELDIVPLFVRRQV